jgi:hypothetical protein
LKQAPRNKQLMLAVLFTRRQLVRAQ